MSAGAPKRKTSDDLSKHVFNEKTISKVEANMKWHEKPHIVYPLMSLVILAFLGLLAFVGYHYYILIMRAVDPYGQEEALYCLPKSRELIHERLVKDADNSARKITEPERPYNRRGSRGGAKNDKEERKGDKARKGGNGGGGGGGNAARSGSQERGKPRGGAESAPRAEK